MFVRNYLDGDKKVTQQNCLFWQNSALSQNKPTTKKTKKKKKPWYYCKEAAVAHVVDWAAA